MLEPHILAVCSSSLSTARDARPTSPGYSKEITRPLSPADLAAFRAWFAEFDARVWDRHFEEDVAAGRLDALADEALRDLQAGRCTAL